MKPITCLSVILLLMLMSATLQADDFNASQFIANQCSSCHGDVVYSRPDRKVSNLQQLQTQVKRCDAALGTTLFDAEMAAVVKYLNQTYYHF